MRIRRLYIKILISFLTVLTVTLVLIFLLFGVTAGKSYKARLDRQTLAKLQIFRTQVQENIDGHPGLPIGDNPDLVKQLNTFAALFDVRIWISDPAGVMLLKTFEGPANVPQRGVHRQIHHDNGITLYHFVLRWIKYYATIPIYHNDRELRLHLYYDTRNPAPSHGLFVMGLLGIGGVVALLVIPLAGYITRRVNRLNRAALAFAGGNLSRRTEIRGHDEIAKLGTSFNLMADRLEALVQNAKELTANVSHELRSPLARLRISKELILDKLDSGGTRKDVQKYADNMEADIAQLDDLVAHMLTLSKMDYQGPGPAREHFSFSAFLDMVLSAYQPLITQAGLELETRVPGDLTVFQDKPVVKSILCNLLDNAVKYTDPGGTIAITASSAPDKGLEISVANPCPPLGDDQMEMVFKPFYRIPGSTAQGSGLGLTIARKQARMCRGEILVHRTRDGIRFNVSLPGG
jgi:signal transduction histidine kinase